MASSPSITPCVRTVSHTRNTSAISRHTHKGEIWNVPRNLRGCFCLRSIAAARSVVKVTTGNSAMLIIVKCPLQPIQSTLGIVHGIRYGCLEPPISHCIFAQNHAFLSTLGVNRLQGGYDSLLLISITRGTIFAASGAVPRPLPGLQCPHCGTSRNKDVNPNILPNFGVYAKRRIRAILFG